MLSVIDPFYDILRQKVHSRMYFIGFSECKHTIWTYKQSMYVLGNYLTNFLLPTMYTPRSWALVGRPCKSYTAIADSAPIVAGAIPVSYRP